VLVRVLIFDKEVMLINEIDFKLITFLPLMLNNWLTITAEMPQFKLRNIFY